MTSLDDLAHRIRPADGDPQGALVLLHGRATSEEDLFPLLDALDPGRRLVGVTPRAPLQLPPGGFHWYITRQVGFPDPDTFEDARRRLLDWLDALAAGTGVLRGRIVVGGFSQGAVMAWAVGAGRGAPRPAGILALSGFIPAVGGFDLDAATLAGLPVAIAHGTWDPVISIGFGREARDRAREAGADVTYLETEVPHTVDPRVLEDLADWVAAR
jgi:phospholipase/carboxylesterase